MLGKSGKQKKAFGFALVMAAVFVVLAALAMSLSALPAEAGSGEKTGRMLFYEAGCANCHHIQSQETKIGPGLKDLFERDGLPASGKPVSEASVRDQIKTPYDRMPSFADRLSEEQIDAIVRYLKSL